MRSWTIGILLACSLVFQLHAEEWSPPKIVAEAAIVIDADRGTTFYEKNADEERAVASTQKLLTALIIAEHGGLEEEVKVERTDTRVEPTRVGIRVGKAYVRGDLLTALLVKSGNDVAKCLARDHAGSQADFSVVMNRRARQLAMGSSNFVNAHGLTEEGQFSTARDMAKLAFFAYRNDTVREAIAVKEFVLGSSTYSNTNQLLHKRAYVTGMKTGFTNAAGRCLIASAAYDGREIIAVVLGSNSKSVWNDTDALIRWSLAIPEEEVIEEEPAEAE